jgi:C-terminal processing protease CtpA/Prc
MLDGGTLYLRYRSIQPIGTNEVRDLLEGGGVERVIVDIRQNPGGDNSTYLILRQLLEDFAEAIPGATTVLTDRVTFSAASNFATEIERRTDARFVGEPMGGGLNFWDDVWWLDLPNLPVPMRAAISVRHWVFADPDDPRLTIEPDVPVEVTAADFFAGRDPALEAALEAALAGG